MAHKKIDEVGNVYGPFTVTERLPDILKISSSGKGRYRARYLVRCECGFKFATTGRHLRRGELYPCPKCGKSIHRIETN